MLLFIVDQDSCPAEPSDSARKARNSGLGLNLGAGIVGILITLVFVERIVKAQQEEDRRRVARGALRKTGESLRGIVRAFSNLLKGSLDAMPSPPPKTISELFSDKLVESLNRCDLGSVEPIGWAEYMNSVLDNSLRGISAAIDMYGAFLPAEYMELLDELHDHVYIKYVRSMFPYIARARPRDAGNEFPLDARHEDRKTFFRTLCRAVELHNQIAENAVEVPVSFASEDYAPELGSLRIAAARPKAGPPPEPDASNELGLPGRPKALPMPRIRRFDP